MKIIVQKFGGSSVGSIEKIFHISNIIKQSLNQGNYIVAVVSAMEGVTNELVSYCLDISKLLSNQEKEECDAILSTGENITSGLLALALQHHGINAKSLQGWQVPIFTNEKFSEATIENINTANIYYYLNKKITPIITGFQGITSNNRITTLGRGGSDISAVALAAALNTKECEIYTDVEGVFTADPKLIKKAKSIEHINSIDMLNLSSLGAKVIHPRAVSIAIKYNISIRIRSSFTKNNLTMISNEIIEGTKVNSITYDNNVVLIQIKENKDNLINIILQKFINNDINTNLITYNNNQLLILISLNKLNKLHSILNCIDNLNYEINTNIVLISIIISGISNQTTIIYAIYNALLENGINILALINNPTTINVVVEIQYLEKSIKLLHNLLCE